jgi:hypothetical protein
MINPQERIASEPAENVVLIYEKCKGREWNVRADCVLECVLCGETVDMVELTEEYTSGTGRWMKTDH